MLTFSGPVEAINALQDFVIDRVAPIPDQIIERIRELLKERSPVVGVTKAIELIYARQVRKEDVPIELRDWAAAAAAMTEDFGFHSMDEGGRGSKMAKVLRGQTVAAKNRPEPDEQAILVADPPPEPEEGLSPVPMTDGESSEAIAEPQ